MAGDEHPAMLTARNEGTTFEGALAAVPPGRGEVPSIDGLLLDLGDDEEYAFAPTGVEGLERVVRLTKGSPGPEGWSRPRLWDTKGFWRVDLAQEGDHA